MSVIIDYNIIVYDIKTIKSFSNFLYYLAEER